jgi:uncharacterized pyridoxamine 5'-phosphate oxidase family protein
MHETEQELAELQGLLDRSYESAGEHLKSVFTRQRRISAKELSELLPGVQVMSLATVTAKCEPRVAPVDGLFLGGRFWFGSSERSQRFRHIRARPAVSANVTRGEQFAVIVHGKAVEVDVSSPQQQRLRDYLHEVYGAEWDEWGLNAPHARIEPERMFTLRFQLRSAEPPSGRS